MGQVFSLYRHQERLDSITIKLFTITGVYTCMFFAHATPGTGKHSNTCCIFHILSWFGALLITSSHRKKRMKQLQKKIKSGTLDLKKDDPFELFVSATNIRYCYYAETHKILGNTYGMCILQVSLAIPNVIIQIYCISCPTKFTYNRTWCMMRQQSLPYLPLTSMDNIWFVHRTLRPWRQTYWPERLKLLKEEALLWSYWGPCHLCGSSTRWQW